MIDLNKIGRKLYLDDLRVPTQTYKETLNCQWMIAKSYQEFVDLITKHGVPEFISFDHDLSFEHYPISEPDGGLKNGLTIPYDSYSEKTGLHCAKWLVDYCMDRNLRLPVFKVHSMNPVGRVNIQSYLDSARRSLNSED